MQYKVNLLPFTPGSISAHALIRLRFSKDKMVLPPFVKELNLCQLQMKMKFQQVQCSKCLCNVNFRLCLSFFFVFLSNEMNSNNTSAAVPLKVTSYPVNK